MYITINELTQGDKVSLKDIGEDTILGTIIIHDIEKFNKYIKRFLRVIEISFYKYDRDWNESFTKLAKRFDFGFKKTRLNKSIEYLLIQEVAPHTEWMQKKYW